MYKFEITLDYKVLNVWIHAFCDNKPSRNYLITFEDGMVILIFLPKSVTTETVILQKKLTRRPAIFVSFLNSQFNLRYHIKNLENPMKGFFCYETVENVLKLITTVCGSTQREQFIDNGIYTMPNMSL